MQDSLDRLVHDLKVIASLRQNDKLCTNGSGMLNIDRPGLFTGFWRYLYSENRMLTISNLQNVFVDAHSACTNHFRRMDQLYNVNTREAKASYAKCLLVVQRMKHSIHRARFGLKHLRSTYENDVSSTARLDVLNERVGEGLKSLEVSMRLLNVPPEVMDALKDHFTNDYTDVISPPDSPKSCQKTNECPDFIIENDDDDT